MNDQEHSCSMSTLQERIILAFKHRKSIAAPGEKVTQLSLARACKCAGPSVHAWFTGKTKTLAGESLIKAARYLGVRAEWLNAGVGPMLHGTDTIAQELENELALIDRSQLTALAVRLAFEFDGIKNYEVAVQTFVKCLTEIMEAKSNN